MAGRDQANGDPILSVRNLHVNVGDQEILKGINLTVNAGEVHAIMGPNGSGKSTLANTLERRLHGEGVFTQVLDGDNIRTGLNSNLGFSDDDRRENIRRIAEVAKLFANAGVVTIASFICPRNELRALAREIVGRENFLEVYVECRFETCERRDVKGLYAKAMSGDQSGNAR